MSEELDMLLAEQVAYYRAVAGEYEDHSLPPLGGDELTAALEGFRPVGRVLELACGQGAWTRLLLQHHADTVTAVDASPEMLAIAAERNPGDRVRFVQADLFEWEPDDRAPHPEDPARTRRARGAAGAPRLADLGYSDRGPLLLGRGGQSG